MTQCMSQYASKQGFPNKVWGDPSQWRGMENVAGGGDLIYMMLDSWGEMILTIQTFFKVKNNIL